MVFQFSSVLTRLGTLSTSDHASVVSMNLFVALLCACIVIGHLLEENRWMNESITALAIVSFTIVKFCSLYNELIDYFILLHGVCVFFLTWKICNRSIW